MVPSFSFLHLYTILSHTGHGKRYGTTSKSNAIPQLTISPYLFLTYTEKFSDKRQTLLEPFWINYPSLIKIARTINQKHSTIFLWGFCSKPFSKVSPNSSHPIQYNSCVLTSGWSYMEFETIYRKTAACSIILENWIIEVFGVFHYKWSKKYS